MNGCSSAHCEQQFGSAAPLHAVSLSSALAFLYKSIGIAARVGVAVAASALLL